MATLINLRFTLAELEILLGLATDQLFRREFIDSKIPGCRLDVSALDVGKQLVQRMKLAAATRNYGRPA